MLADLWGLAGGSDPWEEPLHEKGASLGHSFALHPHQYYKKQSNHPALTVEVDSWSKYSCFFSSSDFHLVGIADLYLNRGARGSLTYDADSI
jgi:hypothetical protein